MLGADLVAAGVRRIEAARLRAGERRRGRSDLWLKVDSYSLLQALAYLAGRLVEEHGVRSVRLRLQRRRQRGPGSTWSGPARR